jgi:hypothetical protein
VAILLLAAALAGCSDPDPTAQEAVPVAADLPMLFAPNVPLPQVQGAGEPNIARLADGTLFVTAPVGGSLKPNAAEGAAYLWRSRDGGETWDVLRSPEVAEMPENAPNPGGGFCSCDADVVTSPDGWVYYSDWWIAGLAPGNYLVEASADGGDTWSAQPVTIRQNIVASMDRQWLVAGEDGFVALFYSFFGSTPLISPPVPAFGLDRPGGQIEAVFSTDHGETWSDPVAVVPASDQGYQIAHPRMAPDGNVWMPYGSVSQGDDTFWRNPSEVRAVVVDRSGGILSDVKVADAPEGFDNLWAVQGATDPVTGSSYAVWAARVDDKDSVLWMARSDDLATWTEPYPVDGFGVNVLPWIDAVGGRVTAGWYGSAFRGDPTDAPSPTEWYALAARWNDTGAWPPSAAAMPIAYVSNEPVKTGPMCPRGAACNGERELLDYVSMVTDGQGLSHYAFARSVDGAAFVHVSQQVGFAAQAWPDG